MRLRNPYNGIALNHTKIIKTIMPTTWHKIDNIFLCRYAKVMFDTVDLYNPSPGWFLHT